VIDDRLGHGRLDLRRNGSRSGRQESVATGHVTERNEAGEARRRSARAKQALQQRALFRASHANPDDDISRLSALTSSVSLALEAQLVTVRCSSGEANEQGALLLEPAMTPTDRTGVVDQAAKTVAPGARPQP
jgi:hypothetical protein